MQKTCRKAAIKEMMQWFILLDNMQENTKTDYNRKIYK